MTLLTVSERMEHSAQRIIPSESPDIANCLRANAALNATDNSLIEYAKDSIASESDAGW